MRLSAEILLRSQTQVLDRRDSERQPLLVATVQLQRC